jgi:Tol biopolymer transport system component
MFQASSPTEADLYVKQIGQEHALRLTNHRAGFVEPAWSPDSRNIAFEMLEKGEVGLYVIPALGGPERKLAEVGKLALFSRISWSADSKWIAFSKEEARETQLASGLRKDCVRVRCLPLFLRDTALQPTAAPNQKALN